MASIGISDVVSVSVYSEIKRMKKLMMMMKIIIINNIISIMNKSLEMTFFSRAPEIDFRYEIKVSKVMVDFQFDALFS